MRKALDIISIEMSPSPSRLVPQSQPGPQPAAPATVLPFQLANDSVTKRYPSINQVRVVMNIQKANVEARPPPAASLGPIIKLSLSLFFSITALISSCVVCFYFKGYGHVQPQAKTRQVRHGGPCQKRLQMQVQAGQPMSSLFFVTISEAWPQEWYDKEKCTHISSRAAKNRIRSSIVHTRKQFSMYSLGTPSSTQEQPYSHPSSRSLSLVLSPPGPAVSSQRVHQHSK